MQYVTYDYEIDRWHIYGLDNEPDTVDFGPSGSLMTITAPETSEWQARIQAICDAINAAVEKAENW